MPDGPSSNGTPSPSRRAMLRALLWGAGGLSLLPASLLGCKSKQVPPTCYAPPPPRDAGLAKQPILVRWVEVGRVWREMSKHNANLRNDREKRQAAFEALKSDMQTALDALPAWPELRVVFEERWQHVERLRYSQATCYVPLSLGTPQPRVAVEKQVSALEKLVEEGRLTKEAAAKAAAALAEQAEYYAQSERLREAASPDKRKALDEQYNAGTLRPSPGATLAGKRLAELTVDDLGMLAGGPTEEELPKPEPPEGAAKEVAP